MFVNFNILNQLGSPAINSNTFANRPAAGQTGRLFVSTDTFEIYRDNGTTWDLIGGPGSSTITGTGTATQVAYFTSSQAIGSSSNLYWDNTNTRLGIGTSTPGVRLDIHGTGTIQHINSTGGANNGYLAFQRAGTTTFSIGDTYNGGSNYFRIFSNSLSADIAQIFEATGKTVFQATETYSSGLARGNYFDFNMSVPNGTTFSTPNAITALGATLDLTLSGSATIPSGARTGLDAYNTVAFTGVGTLTMSQGTQIRAYSNLTAGWSFNGAAAGTITHLAGLRVLFPDNSGGAITVTNNYGLLINNQTANTGTVTYTNRWGIYQEGASDLNYFNGTTLIGSTTNAGNYKLQVTGDAYVTEFLRFSANTKGIIFGTNAATNPYIQGGGSNQLVIGTNNTARITILNDGNVGIGTTSPASVLNVLSTKTTALSTGADFLTLGATIDDNTDFANIGIGGGIAFRAKRNLSGTQTVYGAIDAAKETVLGDEYRGSLRFWTNQNATGIPLERMRITSAGNVGIGTTSPTFTSSGTGLQISSSISAQIRLSNTSYTGFDIQQDNVGQAYLWNRDATAMLFGTSNSERMRITSGGNLGINGSSFGSGTLVIFIANATAVPSTNPTGGGILYVEAGALKYRGSSGTITTIANA